MPDPAAANKIRLRFMSLTNQDKLSLSPPMQFRVLTPSLWDSSGFDPYYRYYRKRQRINASTRIEFEGFGSNRLSIAITTLIVLISVAAATHALLNKQDPRAALGWIALCIAVPIIGPAVYLLLGVNRLNAFDCNDLSSRCPDVKDHEWKVLDHPLDRITAKLSRYPCSRDNKVEILRNGNQAYPAMLDAMKRANQSVFLCTYIFDSDEAGQKFVSALAECANRGVQVRVLIDTIGSLYSFPSAVRLLRKAGVKTSRFLPLIHRNSWLLNMRNHRKILAIDGRLAFTGGMNIGSRHLMGRHRAGAADVQFLIEGSAAHSLADIFCRDWKFATGETLQVQRPDNMGAGRVACRPVSDGPDCEIGTLPKLLLGLIGSAAERITIVTPYFLPPPAIVGALIGASLRGVQVRIVLPEHNNLPYVMWATEHALADILRSSIEVYFQPGPFSHTKLLLIDEDFLQIGSYNMDARSLRLNFELAVNIFDRSLRQKIDSELEEQLSRSFRVEREYLNNRSLPVRIRNAASWLFAPYL